MSTRTISAATRRRVAEFARFRCCYCQTAQRIIGPLLEIDHIFPESRGGAAHEENLALACPLCNSHKLDKIDAVDPETLQVVRLFNPRRAAWTAHFAWTASGAQIEGKTAIGRATVAALQMNDPDLVLVRQLWVTVGWHPPVD